MAGAPQWKVYDGQGTYQAACKEVEAAATIVSFYGDGSTIRYQHGLVVWREGSGEKADGPAAESFDNVAEVAYRRIDEARAAARRKQEQAVQKRLAQVQAAGG